MSSFGLWELMSSGSSANARKNALKTQPRYVSTEEFNAIPSPKEQWNNNSLYNSNVTPQISPTDMNGFQSTVTGAGNISNGLYNNNRLSVQNPLSVGFTPTQVDAVAKNPNGAGNTPSTASTAPISFTPIGSSGAPTVGDNMSQPTQQVNNYGFDDKGSIAGVDFNNADGSFHTPTIDFANTLGSGNSNTDTPYSSMDNFTDFSSKDAAKNSLGNISTVTNVGTGLFDAYSKYQSNKIKADYQNRIASLYEKQYNDTEARRAQAQANYDASVPK